MCDHEIFTCHAVIDIIERRSGNLYKIIRRPDKENRDSKDIDFILTTTEGPDIAVEHTTLDSFENQRGLGHIAVKYIQAVEKEIMPYMHTDTYYYLTMPSHFISNTSKNEQRSVLSELLTWIPDVIESLQPHGHQISRDLLHGRYRFWFGRGGTHPKLNGKLLAGQIAPNNMEEQRLNRIDRAMSDKLNKLAPYKLKGYETLLILDDTDYALSNSMLVEENVLSLHSKYEYCLSNHIYQLTSFKDEIVEAWMLKENELWTDKIPNRGPFYKFKK